ncbi:hypothetical protein [Saccharopolyspora erythraea]|uniref:Uncharacterized protein n=1 Tax=Saccharopolyspora erythraea (strain ATCC 11635 / DSM 40517 / JCM 4748 / NBRC 13426 / NCIMB 8594 / NRRL 2338) TaxID=405948 RepID=A4F706_SACEN|nr:hypothetical protein [Saccharopolyspora erythraea]EQD83128.1 hypothetical protein N599_26905 [Saccharopolyspora erythraea D]CAL99830.1 hypothetical protein SACE_0481 [Saccharopolyspora erythraea NRRL 2338]
MAISSTVWPTTTFSLCTRAVDLHVEGDRAARGAVLQPDQGAEGPHARVDVVGHRARGAVEQQPGEGGDVVGRVVAVVVGRARWLVEAVVLGAVLGVAGGAATVTVGADAAWDPCCRSMR